MDVTRHLCFTRSAGLAAAFLLAVSAAAAVDRGLVRHNGSDPTSVEGLIIDSIIIDNREIYPLDDTTASALENYIFRWANRLHIVTRRSVLRRELLLAKGDRFSRELAEETARNLRWRYAIKAAWWETTVLPNGRLLLRLVTIDEWSLVGGFDFRRDGDQTTIQLGFEERNLLGLNQLLALRYYIREHDNSYPDFRFRDTRFLGRALSLSLRYSDDSRNRLRRISLAHPFYNLNQQWSLAVTAADAGARLDFYDDTDLIGQTETGADELGLVSEYRWGGYTRKVGLVGEYLYRFVEARDKRVFDVSRADLVQFPEDSAYHQLALGVRVSLPQFVVLHRINGFRYDEDFVLGAELFGSVGRAWDARRGGPVYDVARAEVSGGWLHGSTMVLGSATLHWWWNERQRFRRLLDLSLRLYDTRLTFLTVAAGLRYRSDWRSSRTNDLILSGVTGLRGYDRYFRTGDRRLILNLEGRFFSGLEILAVDIGAAVFADLGRTWRAGEPLTLKDFQSSVGIGLRLSLENLTRSELIRIDLSRGQDGLWQVTFGTGQYF